MNMKLNKLYLMLALSILALTANAQEVTEVPAKLKEAQMSGFGSKNREAILQGAKADSIAKAAAQQAAKVEGDTDPEFPGGEIFLQAYLKKKLLHSDVSGKGDVVISFKVDKKGNIYGAEVTKISRQHPRHCRLQHRHRHAPLASRPDQRPTS